MVGFGPDLVEIVPRSLPQLSKQLRDHNNHQMLILNVFCEGLVVWVVLVVVWVVLVVVLVVLGVVYLAPVAAMALPLLLPVLKPPPGPPKPPPGPPKTGAELAPRPAGRQDTTYYIVLYSTI